jgi:hypothetical protein
VRAAGLAVVWGILLVTAGAATAQPPVPVLGPLPPPHSAPAYLGPVPYTRPNPYDVWQNYGTTRSGRWRPLVIYGPYGAYYRYNGAPYPWPDVHPGYLKSNLRD